ncbi:enoyl-CoA hydratase [Hyphomicrobium sulfonivorans]|uniref:enoyl-CoA hydratase n=1 Tax=Hyphomicrobium sulfonivorans TaxID=121290 RepID=UPI00156D92E7|nr:enoyl-CoA hydratase [Hyphomicrobium sulfonivorans]MBI1651007.1 enoyl-CoA hydratase [Hyphomicrobium sulfonivorans]NSL72610.1 enoyl-CoA hydratase [Hyphomicrobium sulfonivorans]
MQHQPEEASTDSAAHSEVLLLLERPVPRVALLTLNRPAARNALSLALLEALQSAVEALGRDDDISVIVIAAAGPVFSSGHDLKELTAHRADTDAGLAFFTETMTRCASVMQAIIACPKPVIAAVQGTATAAGCQLVATCDLAVAAENAHFATPGVNIGLFCSTPMVALSRNVSRKIAMEMLLLGEMITAEQAAAHGLVNRVVPQGQALEHALAMAEKIAVKSPLTVSIGKRAFYEQAQMPLAEAYAYTADVMVRNMLARDAEEGIGAFLGKRKPEWKGC